MGAGGCWDVLEVIPGHPPGAHSPHPSKDSVRTQFLIIPLSLKLLLWFLFPVMELKWNIKLYIKHLHKNMNVITKIKNNSQKNIF